MSEHLRFLATFIKHPFSVGAVAPSSRWLASRMLEDMELDRPQTVVELGPGTGAFTRVILDHMHPESVYLAMELNGKFAADLARKFPQINVVNDSAESLVSHLAKLGKRHADRIFCGLPWASFPPGLQRRIMTAVVSALRPGGRFATFAYVHAAWFPTARKFHHFLKSHFLQVSTTRVVWRNLPPAFIYRCEL
jgi:phosphatidylethanolamine/phosphatidyl-N-methylethanolamine N-methyltransferase